MEKKKEPTIWQIRKRRDGKGKKGRRRRTSIGRKEGPRRKKVQKQHGPFQPTPPPHPRNDGRGKKPGIRAAVVGGIGGNLGWVSDAVGVGVGVGMYMLDQCLTNIFFLAAG